MISKTTRWIHYTARTIPTNLLIVTILLLLSIHRTQSLDHTSKLDNNQDNSGSQDDNTDRNQDGSYDQSSSSDSGDGTETDLPPIDLSVIRLNDTSVVLRWDNPENVQDRLQFFKIQYKSTKKGTEWKTEDKEIPATARAYQINGLKPGNYLFSVIAVYHNNDNIPSKQLKYRLRASSKVSPDEMPELKAPVIHWTEAKSDYFRFKWKYNPKDKDMEWFGYLVYYRSAHAVSDYNIYNTLDESVEIALVEPDTPYQAKVVAYNQHGVSRFSDTITIRTLPRNNITTQVPMTTEENVVSTPTTPQPTVSSTTFTEFNLATSTQAPEKYSPNSQIEKLKTTQKPQVVTYIKDNNSTTTSTYQSIRARIEQLLGDQSDATVISAYILILVMLILLIFLILSCSLGRNRGNNKDSRPSSKSEPNQYDLEINGYFKNSFPGVEKEFQSVMSYSGHQDFVNDHPHINDFQ